MPAWYRNPADLLLNLILNYQTYFMNIVISRTNLQLLIDVWHTLVTCCFHLLATVSVWMSLLLHGEK